MRRGRHLAWSLCLLAAAAGCVACDHAETPPVGRDSDGARKIPITTSSPRAQREFLHGRQLVEDLKIAEARPHFERAVALDPTFAQAWLALATTAGTAQEFFEPLRRAVARADHVCPGERHMILGLEAGANSDLVAQYDHYRAMVRLYPEDERARLLLGTYFLGRQDYDGAIEQFRRAAAINPQFAPAFNQLGYAYRFAGRYADAEAAFKRYIELLPEQPNPYDSYAELMMKMGRFEESIRNYRIALAKDPEFLLSYRGIGYDQVLMGRYGDARASFGHLLDQARNDGERRQALFWVAVSYLHQENFARALEVLRRRERFAEEAHDLATRSADAAVRGVVLMESGDLPQARQAFGEAADWIGRAEVSPEVRSARMRNLIYQRALVELRAGRLDAAAESTQDLAEGVAKVNVPLEVRRLHELRGRLAWAHGDASAARHELESANLLDPRTLLLLSRVCAQQGDRHAAIDYARSAADFNAFSLNYAFVRADAQAFLKQLTSH